MKSKELILECYEKFHLPQYLEWDPLLIIHRYKNHEDLELVALICALFAFGGVKQIIASVERALQLLGPNLWQWLQSEEDENRVAELLLQRLEGFKHRIYVGRDLVMLLLIYRRSKLAHGSLENHFLKYHSAAEETVGLGLTGLIADLKSAEQKITFRPGLHFKHMLNSPAQGSTCKRWLMYLKWMIRADDGIDIGLWVQSPGLRPDQLVIPLDVHLFNISKKLRLTRKKTANWLTAVDVTRQLKKIDALDPLKFDFAICRWGMFDYRKKLTGTLESIPSLRKASRG
jgi:uncharacterized protein (TIGR02757 family)